MLCCGLIFTIAMCILNNLTHCFLRPQCGIVGCAQWHVIRQPDIEVKPVLNIFRKELRFELVAGKTTKDQEKRRSEENGPSMLNCPTHHAVIKTVKTTLTFLLQRGFSLGRPSLNVVSQEWNKRHGDD